MDISYPLIISSLILLHVVSLIVGFITLLSARSNMHALKNNAEVARLLKEVSNELQSLKALTVGVEKSVLTHATSDAEQHSNMASLLRKTNEEVMALRLSSASKQ